MPGTNIEKVHVSVTGIIGVLVPILLWNWSAQADGLKETQAVAAKNAAQITVLINENQNRKETEKELKEQIKANGDVARSVERTVDRIAAKLQVEDDDNG